mmetsp:Transcript_9454/g.18205  ORF Transcript_9454/g.18205 Transcript_9454/m.18205 type:complete len:96 (+) Transcript_9454:2752-3039(+)
MQAENCVFVGNLPYSTTEDQLRHYLEVVGPVVSVKIPLDSLTGATRGFAFCEYLEAEFALCAHKNLNGVVFQGRNLRIEVSKRTPTRSAAPTPPS